ncbi:hypothetical protein [Celerinatantimonas sp. YJH-8]|uniref:hypothetical protein n=1 Tax=Celerinatantimonas sp. YJH-8 TaxID=3228714 RepID=UPI0038C2515C
MESNQVTQHLSYEIRKLSNKQRLVLSSRPSLNSIRDGKLLFFDNTKLGFCHYRTIYTTLKYYLYQHSIVNLDYVRKSVRGTMTEQMRDLARELSQKNYCGAILALADMGTSVMTTILAIELEKLGVPSVLISAPPGDKLAEHVAYYRAGNLCICHLDIFQASTDLQIKEQTLAHAQYILEALCSQPESLAKLATLSPQMDRDLLENASDSIQYTTLDELLDIYDEKSIGDGLPVVPPTPARFEKMQEYCAESLDSVIIPEAGPSGNNITIRDIILNSILAGCKPEYLPIVIQVFKAMTAPTFNFQQSITTSYNGGNLVLISGPIAKELHISSGQGCLGTGFRANATIGRAVNLTILNICRAYPGKADLGCLGSPAEFTYCFAESLENSLWPTLNEERYNAETTTVYLMKAEPPTDVVDFLSQNSQSLLEVIISSATHLGRMNAYIPGRILIVLTPDHAQMLKRDGWSKNDLRHFLHNQISNPRNTVAGKGLVPVRPEGFNDMENIPATRSPSDIDLVVAGGRGGHSAIIASWGLYSDAVISPLLLPNGITAKSIHDFKC